MAREYFNGSGCADPTAHKAIENIQRENRMTHKRLKRYRPLLRETKKLQAKLLTLNPPVVSDSVSGSMDGWPYTKKAIPVQGIDLSEVNRKRERIQKNKLEIERIKNFIAGVDDPTTRQAMEAFYLNGEGWLKVSMDLGYQTEAGARMRVERFLKKS